MAEFVAPSAESEMTKLVVTDGPKSDFNPIPFTLSYRATADGAARFTKWGLNERLIAARFRLRERFDPEAAQAFLLDFFNSASVRASFAPFTGAKKPTAAPLTGVVESVRFEKLATAVTDMAFFDRFATAGCVNSELGSGRVRAQMEDVFDGITVGDALREALANPDSEHSELYSEREKRELVYRIFKFMALGGGMVQWEDEWGPYLDATRSVYRDLVTVVKAADGAGIEVASHVYDITALVGASPQLFPSALPHHICWVVVDPVKSQVSLVYHAWVSFW
jgi:cilia- and flagella-associated protein 300